MDKILVTRSSMPSLEEYTNEISSIFDTHWLTNMGAKHQQLEKELHDLMGGGDLNVRLFTNGHLALEMAIEAFHFPRGGEVITTPFTFASTTNAIVRNGLVPVFCDIREDDYTIDPVQIESLVTPRTVAIVPVHVYGNICDTDAIQSIAERHSLKVIYDAAHAFAEKVRGADVGTFGDVSMFSFHATKVFNTIEGGAACTRDAGVAEELNRLKNFGIAGEEELTLVGGNAKMNEFQAAMGLCNLRHLKDEIGKRSLVCAKYRERLAPDRVSGIILNSVRPDIVSNYAYFPVRIIPEQYGHDRNELYDKLKEHGIYSRKYFYPLTSSCLEFGGKYDPQDTPAAKRISEEILTLPMFADLTAEEVDRICDIIVRFGE